ncbi:MAG: hypothetical protein ABIJ41_00835 [Candidatus Omnitrophota bacterium]
MKEKFLIVLKFIIFVCLIPVVIAATRGFVEQMSSIPDVLRAFFLWGIFVYIFVHVFICEPKELYAYGQKIVSQIFRFFAPLVEVAPYFLPIYAILLLIIFYFVVLIFKAGEYGRYFMFMLSFFLTMHFTFTAKQLRAKEENALKPNYFFSISIIYIANIVLLSLFLDLIIDSFSFVELFTAITRQTEGIYSTIFHQLFLS